MRIIYVILVAVIILPGVLGVKTGYCTGQYVEKGDSWIPGLIQKGDVFEYWCELPSNITESESLEIKISYPNAELVKTVLAPRPIYGTQVVLFP